MKKLITKILSMALILVLACGFLSGCELITTDVEADMKQVVATVQLEGMEKEEIKKGQLVSAFNSNGYTYMYYYGYTQAQAYEEILKSLVNDRIIVQQAKLAFTTSSKTLGNKEDKGYFLIASEVAEKDLTNKDKVLIKPNYEGTAMTSLKKSDSVDKFLTEYEEKYSRYSVLKSIDSLIESYIETEEEEHNHNHESFKVSNRTTLKVEEEKVGNEWEIENDAELSKITEDYVKSFKKDIEALEINVSNYATKYELSNAIYEKYISNFKFDTKERRKALNKVIKDLNKNGFITADEANALSKDRPNDAKAVLNISFFKQALTDAYENALVSKLELAIENQEEKLLSDDDSLYNEYKILFDSQKATFDKDYTAYETALEGASESSFVVYNPTYKDAQGKTLQYGYIANLLIGFNATQEAELKAYEEKVVGDKNKLRDLLLKDLTAKDLRSTWVLSNYGKYNEGEFTFGDDYCKTDALKKFNGTLIGANSYIEHDEYDEEQTKYTFKAVEATEMSFDAFYKDIVQAVMGFNAERKGKLENVTDENLISYTISKDVMTKYRDIIYAYSTDPGSLSENYGYLYSPISSKNKYVKEYADAAQRLIANGVGSYEVVATEFGYHIMLCTSVIKPSELANNTTKIEKSAFLAEVGTSGTLPYLFKEYKHNLISATKISDITNTIINQNSNDNIVKYNKSTYEDLVEEAK